MAFHRSLPRLKKVGPRSGRTKPRAGDNLLLRLQRFKDDVLRFLVDFEVPFTNNLAEQALRMMKVKMKISGGFRTPEGAQAFAALRSVIATANSATTSSTPSPPTQQPSQTQSQLEKPGWAVTFVRK
jgi:transposase